jgi:GNAT superfamily N-acetyltransferase
MRAMNGVTYLDKDNPGNISLFEDDATHRRCPERKEAALFLGSKWGCSSGVIRILYSSGDLIVRTTCLKDMAFIDKVQKDNSYAVGFIQKTVWERYVFGGERNFVALVCEKNMDPVGYVLITPGMGAGSSAKIQQIAVRNDARRLDYGTALLAVGKDFCEDFGRRGFTLRCRIDLESNLFWKALGFENYGVWKKGRVNHVGMVASNDINLWRIGLNDKQGMIIFPKDEPRAEET